MSISPRSILVSAATAWLPNGNGPFWRYAVAFAVLAVSLLVGTLVHTLLPDRIFITLFPAVAVVSLLSGLVPALLISLVGGLTAIYFWMPPYEGWPLAGPVAANVSVFMIMSSIIAVFGHLVRQLVSELRHAREAADLRASEMQHRIQNLFNVIVAVGRGTVPKDDAAVRAFWSGLEGRLQGLSAAQHLLLKPESIAELEPLIWRVLGGHEQSRFRISGDPCQVVTSTQLVLAIHELATNSLKYGALSMPAGTVEISWTLGPDAVNVQWVERGGPPVIPPAQHGFGSKVLGYLKARRVFDSDGVRVSFIVPRAH